jgi:hypothetical protein
MSTAGDDADVFARLMQFDSEMAADGARAKDGDLHPASPLPDWREPSCSLPREAVMLFIISRSASSPQLFILQALRVRTMPILLSINPPFELLRRDGFGTVPYERQIISTMTFGCRTAAVEGKSEFRQQGAESACRLLNQGAPWLTDIRLSFFSGPPA